MGVQKKNINKICNFYINEWHLVTAILPYVAKLVEEKEEIIVYCENSINQNIEIVLSRINIKEETKEKIKKINFGMSKVDKIEFKKDLSIIVSGSEDYIKEINIEIDNNIKNSSKEKKVRIINCYNISEKKINIKRILKSYKTLLKTSGEISLKTNNV